MENQFKTPLARISADICLFGNKGSGKTLMMVYYMLLSLQMGKQIFANFHVDLPMTYISSLDDLTSDWFKNGVAFLDDIEAWLWSRDAFSKKNKQVTEIALNMGKRGLSCIWSTKRPMNADLILRDTTIWFIECRFMLKTQPTTLTQFMDHIQYLDNYYILGTVYDYLGQHFKYEILDDLPIYGELYSTTEQIGKLRDTNI